MNLRRVKVNSDNKRLEGYRKEEKKRGRRGRDIEWFNRRFFNDGSSDAESNAEHDGNKLATL
uniref:Uncharacterized protein n=1 Tax=Pristionchus pacificus TaxID=54126 RepID=A0A2A6C316_PRIPA|eukprot:PDM72423.1 hypothetical protein PRIPAC_38857 [Pristionchus pacificus]